MTGSEVRMARSDSMTDDSFEVVSPRADHLMESLRGTGYSLPGAISDLIDNSITAGARNVWLHFHWAGAGSWVSILDDGCGMSEAELVDAMRSGSRSPREDREASDLGRFGLGLKTASISQARSLTVATHTVAAEAPSVRQWDLDHLASVGEWQLRRIPIDGLGSRVEPLSKLAQGTLVVWEKLDRLVGDVGSDDERARGQFLESLQAVEKHIGMVFHRFMAGRQSVSIWLNDREIVPWDPFLTDEDATQQLAMESLGQADEVRVTPYVLPHHSRLTTAQHSAAGGPAGWNAQQGFYVYRNRRLLLPGDWLGLEFRKEEHYKLARIRVDLSNSSDDEWAIDVRKSRARPPLRFRDDLLLRAVGGNRHEVAGGPHVNACRVQVQLGQPFRFCAALASAHHRPYHRRVGVSPEGAADCSHSPQRDRPDRGFTNDAVVRLPDHATVRAIRTRVCSVFVRTTRLAMSIHPWADSSVSRLCTGRTRA